MEIPSMRGPNYLWILWLAAALVLAPACTENDLDESDADVFLTMVGNSQPAVEAGDVQGFCSGNNTIECNNDLTCSDQGLGFCVFVPTSGCDVKEWSITFQNNPINDGAIESDLNGAVVESLVITYPPATGLSPLLVRIGLTIPVGGTGTLLFRPILQQEITVDGVDIAVDFTWQAESVAGQEIEVIGANGGVLRIEECLAP
jgi:hypothetical protein